MPASSSPDLHPGACEFAPTAYSPHPVVPADVDCRCFPAGFFPRTVSSRKLQTRKPSEDHWAVPGALGPQASGKCCAFLVSNQVELRGGSAELICYGQAAVDARRAAQFNHGLLPYTAVGGLAAALAKTSFVGV